MTAPGGSWPPAPRGQPPVGPPPDDGADGAEEALHHGWRLLLLGTFCAPPVFLPLAAWQGVAANRKQPGAGTNLLLAAGGVSAFWLIALLLLAYFGPGK